MHVDCLRIDLAEKAAGSQSGLANLRNTHWTKKRLTCPVCPY